MADENLSTQGPLMDVASIWADLLTEKDRAVIANAGYGKTRGFGTAP